MLRPLESGSTPPPSQPKYSLLSSSVILSSYLTLSFFLLTLSITLSYSPSLLPFRYSLSYLSYYPSPFSIFCVFFVPPACDNLISLRHYIRGSDVEILFLIYNATQIMLSSVSISIEYNIKKKHGVDTKRRKTKRRLLQNSKYYKIANLTIRQKN